MKKIENERTRKGENAGEKRTNKKKKEEEITRK